MSRSDASQLDHGDVEVESDEAGRRLPGALRSTWYLWVGVLVAAVLAWIAVAFEELGRSPFEVVLFGSLAVALFLAATGQLLREWRVVDRVQA